MGNPTGNDLLVSAGPFDWREFVPDGWRFAPEQMAMIGDEMGAPPPPPPPPPVNRMLRELLQLETAVSRIDKVFVAERETM